jgi:hypothetical protein
MDGHLELWLRIATRTHWRPYVCLEYSLLTNLSFLDQRYPFYYDQLSSLTQNVSNLVKELPRSGACCLFCY